MWSKDTNFIKWHLGGEDSSQVILAVAQLLPSEPGSQLLTNATDRWSIPGGEMFTYVQTHLQSQFCFPLWLIWHWQDSGCSKIAVLMLAVNMVQFLQTPVSSKTVEDVNDPIIFWRSAANFSSPLCIICYRAATFSSSVA